MPLWTRRAGRWTNLGARRLIGREVRPRPPTHRQTRRSTREAWPMNSVRPHTRPHTNRRIRRCGVELKRSPRLKVAGSNPAAESPKWCRSVDLDRTRTAGVRSDGPRRRAPTLVDGPLDGPLECSVASNSSTLPGCSTGISYRRDARRACAASRPDSASRRSHTAAAGTRSRPPTGLPLRTSEITTTITAAV
jgi:hypothetical protein